MIDPQLIRIEAAKLTAQVLAGSGADPQRTMLLFWTFVAAMTPPEQKAPANDRPNLTPIDGGKKD